MSLPGAGSIPKRVIIDTDPGIDDALAILLALRSPEIKVEAITTVCGNVLVDQGTENALKILELAGESDIPVARGAEKPLVRKPSLADVVHGGDGLGGARLATPTRGPERAPARELIDRIVSAAPGEITVIAVGPLTNIATVFRDSPAVVSDIREIIVMGGALSWGNATPAAEFNIHADAEAARVVVEAGAPLTLLTLEATRQAVLERKRLAQFHDAPDPLAAAVAEMAEHYVSFAESAGQRGAALHDPLAVGLAIDRAFAVETQPMRIDVETRGKFTYGRTVANPWLRYRCKIDMGEYYRDGPRVEIEPNANVPTRIDGERFVDFFLHRLTG